MECVFKRCISADDLASRLLLDSKLVNGRGKLEHEHKFGSLSGQDGPCFNQDGPCITAS